jgi:aryl-alcohol dehydrogenase-like predicted oxidoreductase
MELNRRQFITSTIAGAAGLALCGNAPADAVAAAAEPNPFETVTLGKTSIKTSRLCLGTGMTGGMRQSNHTRMGKERFNALVQGAWDRGIRCFDSADLYGTHPFLADALKDHPREQYTIFTKIWVSGGGIPERERPDANIVVDRFRKELKTDYIDLVLIHCMTAPTWTDQQKKQMDIMDDLKSKGIIKAHGVSIHSVAALKLCATTPWVDSVHTRINPYGQTMDDRNVQTVVDVLKQIDAAGKGLVGMKIMGEGHFKDDEHKDKSIAFVMGLGIIDVFNVGFEKVEEIDDFVKRVKAVKANA